MSLFYFLIASAASCLGSLAGIGGGVVIKPVMDVLSGLPIETINFMSGCAVLSMSSFSTVRSRLRGASPRPGIGYALAAGAALGGVAGKTVFQVLAGLFSDSGPLFTAQSSMLLIINVAVLIYSVNRGRLKSFTVSGITASAVIGLLLGIVSAFLGIGGGPINIAVLALFFSMEQKEAAPHSIFIIFCSQAASLLSLVITGDIPAFDPLSLALMCVGGVLGALIGGSIARRLDEKRSRAFFCILTVVIICINIINIVKYAS